MSNPTIGNQVAQFAPNASFAVRDPEPTPFPATGRAFEQWIHWPNQEGDRSRTHHHRGHTVIRPCLEDRRILCKPSLFSVRLPSRSKSPLSLGLPFPVSTDPDKEHLSRSLLRFGFDQCPVKQPVSLSVVFKRLFGSAFRHCLCSLRGTGKRA
jgi:hypothetical protein